MTDYVVQAAWDLKDSNNSVVSADEFDVEFNEIATAISSKANISGPTFLGTVTIADLNFTGTLITGTIQGGTY